MSAKIILEAGDAAELIKIVQNVIKSEPEPPVDTYCTFCDGEDEECPCYQEGCEDGGNEEYWDGYEDAFAVIRDAIGPAITLLGDLINHLEGQDGMEQAVKTLTIATEAILEALDDEDYDDDDIFDVDDLPSGDGDAAADGENSGNE